LTQFDSQGTEKVDLNVAVVGRSRWLPFTIVFVSFFVFYAAFRSPDLMAVDGAVRSCGVFHHQAISFHGNNHLLYPLNVWVWDRLIRLVAGPCPDALEFARRTQLMNGMAAALGVAILFLLVRDSTGAPGIALGAAAAYGCSRCVLLHATNAAEPAVGVFWSFVAMAAAALARGGNGRRAWVAAPAGVLLAAGMATYQSMILVGPAVLLLCAAPTTEQGACCDSVRRGQALRVTGFLIGSTAGVVGIYGAAYAHQGIGGFRAQLQRFFTVDGGPSVYGGLSASKAVNTPVGLVGNLFQAYPADYMGLRWLFRQHATDGWAVWLIFLLSAGAICGVFLAGLVWRCRANLGLSQRLGLAVAAVALAITLVGPLYWTATYDKLWLQPVAALIVLAALALAALPPSPARRTVTIGLMAMVIVEVASNGFWIIPSLGREMRYVREARQVEEILRPDDVLIHEWDGVSVLYTALYGPGRPQYCLPTFAQGRGAAVVDDLREVVRRADSQGVRVYFLGVMDVTEPSWQSFLGSRLHVPYHALDEFRERCRVVATFPLEGGVVTLRLCETASTLADHSRWRPARTQPVNGSDATAGSGHGFPRGRSSSTDESVLCLSAPSLAKTGR
jgi:hypothetical protein